MIRQIFPYAATTAGLTVRVAPRYLADQSDPARNYHVWAYQVRIENGTAAPVQLLSRFWVITDGYGRTEEVSGDGVVGVQPVIGPGQAYDYVSGCPLATASGTMEGFYTMTRGGDDRFNIAIPAFALVIDGAKPTIN
jgi:ApaG protein